MNEDGNFPKLSSAQHTGAAGVTVVAGLVENELKWRFRRNHQENDFGIDGYVDIVRSDGAVLGKSFAVQIKTGPSHVAKTSDQGFLLYGEIKHLNYFLNFSVPVVLVWVDDSKKQAWWVHVTPHAIRMTKTGWSILIPKASCFDASSRKDLAALAGPTSDYLPLVEQLNKMRNIACQSDLLLFQIAKIEVDTGDVSRLKDFFQMFEAAPDVLPNMRNKLVLGVQGYDDDSREVYEIPEVRDWFSKAEKAVLGWSYYLLLESEFSTFPVFFFCTCKLEVQGASKEGTYKLLRIARAEGKAFIERHFNWLNQFTEKHQIPLSVNREISLAMGKAARQWFEGQQ
jgi:hypothetical protein